jgi:hypothetical protein
VVPELKNPPNEEVSNPSSTDSPKLNVGNPKIGATDPQSNINSQKLIEIVKTKTTQPAAIAALTSSFLPIHFLLLFFPYLNGVCDTISLDGSSPVI